MEVRHLSVRCVTALDKTHPKFRPENMLFCLRIKQAAKSCEELFWCVTALDTLRMNVKCSTSLFVRAFFVCELDVMPRCLN